MNAVLCVRTFYKVVAAAKTFCDKFTKEFVFIIFQQGEQGFHLFGLKIVDGIELFVVEVLTFREK